VEQASIKQKEKAKYTVCKIAMENSFRIKDEIMLLCIKQIRKNKRKLSAESAWGMLACMLSLTSPSEGLSYPMMNWLINVVELHPNQAYKDWASYCLARAYRTFINEDKRFFSPHPMEMAYVSNRKGVKIPLYCSNGAFITMWIESYNDFEELKAEALLRLGLKTEHHWRYTVIEIVEYDTKYGM
jgi:hypothetical protein